MDMNLPEELVCEIGQILMRNAQKDGNAWDFCGYMFETRDGVSSGGEVFNYHQKKRLPFRLGRDIKEITNAFKRLREVSQVEGDAFWIKCLAVLRSDGDFKMLFEFDDWTRWSITPANVNDAFEILIGEAYPEVVKE